MPSCSLTTSAPTQVGSVILHPAGTTASYEFQVTPALATRYRVELFQSSTASAPIGTSAMATIYVVIGGASEYAQTCAARSAIVLFTDNYVPPSALQTEMSTGMRTSAQPVVWQGAPAPMADARRRQWPFRCAHRIAADESAKRSRFVPYRQ